MKAQHLPPISRFLKWHWRRMKDNESRLVFPPGQYVFSGITKSGKYLIVNPGAMRMPFKINFEKEPRRNA